MSDPSPRSIAILGAGITGLTAAHRLATLGHRVRVFEKSDRIGGAIRTEHTDGWLIEQGPNSLLAGDPLVDALIREVGLEPERRAANPLARRRYLVRDGQPIAVPSSPRDLLKSRLFSFRAKARLLREFFARPRQRKADLSLADFVRQHFGPEFVDYALNPIVNGVYAGDPAKLSAREAFPSLWEWERTHGSLLRGQLAATKAQRARHEPPAEIISFRRGLQTLPEALAARLPADAIRLNARVETLTHTPEWKVIWNDGHGVHSETFDQVIAALPAAGLAGLRFGMRGERPLASLDAIDHPPLASLFLGYRRDQVAHPLDGFGMLIPEVEQRTILGVLFSSTLFPGRAPDGMVALTVMVGGARHRTIAGLDAEALLAKVQPDLSALLGVSGAPVFSRHHAWPRAIPQFNVGHERFREAIAACERRHPGLFIGGQAHDGIALPTCIRAGEKLAEQVRLG